MPKTDINKMNNRDFRNFCIVGIIVGSFALTLAIGISIRFNKIEKSLEILIEEVKK